ncbi:MAG: helix-turn-helix domain-containing protein [Anaerolineae bacterium]|nr:helix-turn-helix domain-containing protein [Anaerolineae bacterium]
MTRRIELQVHSEEERERRDAAANRALLLETAERLFTEQGVEPVTMAEIAQVAGVGKGTLYRRFAHKGELCLALLDNQLLAFQDSQLDELRQLHEREVPYLEQLAHFLRAVVAFTEQHMPLLCEIAQYTPVPDGEDLERPHSWQYMTVHGLIRRAQNAGELAPDVDAPFLAEALLAPLVAHTYRFQRERLGFTPERVSEGLSRIVQDLAAAS